VNNEKGEEAALRRSFLLVLASLHPDEGEKKGGKKEMEVIQSIREREPLADVIRVRL